MKAAAIAMIRLYQGWSIRLTPVCRFHPSCSQYAIDAVETHGLARGLYLALRRVARCRPGGGFGFDPVPTHRSSLTSPRS